MNSVRGTQIIFAAVLLIVVGSYFITQASASSNAVVEQGKIEFIDSNGAIADYYVVNPGPPLTVTVHIRDSNLNTASGMQTHGDISGSAGKRIVKINSPDFDMTGDWIPVSSDNNLFIGQVQLSHDASAAAAYDGQVWTQNGGTLKATYYGCGVSCDDNIDSKQRY
jgi:hypothetical protein